MLARVINIIFRIKLEATYYYRKKYPLKEQRVYNGGRKIPGYSLILKNQPISDEQIKEWLLELIAGEESAYGYRKLTRCLQRQYNLVVNKKNISSVQGVRYIRAATPGTS